MSNIVCLKANEINLYNIAEFIVNENFLRHESYNDQNKVQKNIRLIYDDDNTSKEAIFFLHMNNFDVINGSIRVIKWNRKEILPLEKLFSINPSSLICNNVADIWHIGRLAIKKGCDDKSLKLFKTLMVCAINEICKNKNSIAIAECDSKLLKALKYFGLEAFVLGNSIHYLGSETFPIMLGYDTLKKFLNKNLYLLDEVKDYATT